jgi:hypothetical protein
MEIRIFITLQPYNNIKQQKVETEKIIEDLKERLKFLSKEEMNSASWNYEEGILITGNEAKKIIALYDFYKDVVNSHGVENNKEICKLKKKIK